MKRFLLVLALVAVAGATYVATAPGSQTAGPTARQFNILKRQVAVLKGHLGQVRHLLHDCMYSGAPITRRGDWQSDPVPTFGYSYSDPSINSGAPFPETALDIANNSDSNVGWIAVGGPKCGADLGTSLRKAGRGFGVARH